MIERTQPANFKAWGLGTKMRNGRTHIRRVVWGRVMARAEQRQGENIYRVELSIVESDHGRRRARAAQE